MGVNFKCQMVEAKFGILMQRSLAKHVTTWIRKGFVTVLIERNMITF